MRARARERERKRRNVFIVPSRLCLFPFHPCSCFFLIFLFLVLPATFLRPLPLAPYTLFVSFSLSLSLARGTSGSLAHNARAGFFRPRVQKPRRACGFHRNGRVNYQLPATKRARERERKRERERDKERNAVDARALQLHPPRGSRYGDFARVSSRTRRERTKTDEKRCAGAPRFTEFTANARGHSNEASIHPAPFLFISSLAAPLLRRQ